MCYDFEWFACFDRFNWWVKRSRASYTIARARERKEKEFAASSLFGHPLLHSALQEQNKENVGGIAQTLTWMKRIRISISHKYRHNPTIFRRSRIIQWTLTAIAHTLKYFSIKERFLFIARFESMTTNNNNNNCKQTATTSDVCASQCYKNTRLDV